MSKNYIFSFEINNNNLVKQFRTFCPCCKFFNFIYDLFDIVFFFFCRHLRNRKNGECNFLNAFTLFSYYNLHYRSKYIIQRHCCAQQETKVIWIINEWIALYNNNVQRYFVFYLQTVLNVFTMCALIWVVNYQKNNLTQIGFDIIAWFIKLCSA